MVPLGEEVPRGEVPLEVVPLNEEVPLEGKVPLDEEVPLEEEVPLGRWKRGRGFALL